MINHARFVAAGSLWMPIAGGSRATRK